MDKPRASRNRTLTLTADEQAHFERDFLRLSAPVQADNLLNRVICQDVFEVVPFFPQQPFIDLLFLDPPYNMDKRFNQQHFRQMSNTAYSTWLERLILGLLPSLKPTASVYVCCTWEGSSIVSDVLSKHFQIQNRITWEREKGRGAKRNWKNASEDIWFCTMSDNYVFNVDAVKLKRRVLAPYTHEDGLPKDWSETDDGRYRLTHPSNLWTDLTVPFWSMPENTDHPTQKPEKLLAKLILASTSPHDVVVDPFLGSGTTAATATKLGRYFVGIEIDPLYAALSLKRVNLAQTDKTIQGYSDGAFWERNSAPQTRLSTPSMNTSILGQPLLLDDSEET